MGIGLALLGYGVPGFLAGPLIGSLVDRYGRGKLLPWGLGIGAAAGAALVPAEPLGLAAAMITLLSLGFDMSHPLLAGIVTTLDPAHRGQAMGLNSFTVFLGFGLGSLLFGWAPMHWDFTAVMGTFTLVELLLAVSALRLFRAEVPAPHEPAPA